MVPVIAPAIDGLRRVARGLREPRRDQAPVLALHRAARARPSLLSAMVLLFGNSFAAYATAYGLTAGGVARADPDRLPREWRRPLQPALADALALGMFVVLGLMMAVYIPLQRISSRWVR